MKSYVILFDGICNLCTSSVQFIIKRDTKNQFKFASLQSDFGQEFLRERGLPTQELNSIILYEAGIAYYTKSTAALKIARALGFPFSLLYIFMLVPASIRNIIYSFIASNRYKWFGKKESCMIPTPELTNKFLK